MKKLLVLVVLGVAAWLGYTTFLSREPSAAEQRVTALDSRLDAALQRFHQASRGAAIGGIDTTAAAEAARTEIESVAREVSALERSAVSAEEKEGVQRLRGRIRQAKEAIGER